MQMTDDYAYEDDMGMLSSWVTQDLIKSRPYNGLTPSEMIISDQNSRILGIDDFSVEPTSAMDRKDLLAAYGPQPIPADLAKTMSPDGKAAVAGVNGRSLASGFWEPSVPQTKRNSDDIIPRDEESKPRSWMYDGPERNDASSVTRIMDDVGLPTSFKRVLGDAEAALVGITSDLTSSTSSEKSVSDIFLSDGRMRGLGSLLIIAAIIGIVFRALFGTK